MPGIYNRKTGSETVLKESTSLQSLQIFKDILIDFRGRSIYNGVKSLFRLIIKHTLKVFDNFKNNVF